MSENIHDDHLAEFMLSVTANSNQNAETLVDTHLKDIIRFHARSVQADSDFRLASACFQQWKSKNNNGNQKQFIIWCQQYIPIPAILNLKMATIQQYISSGNQKCREKRITRSHTRCGSYI